MKSESDSEPEAADRAETKTNLSLSKSQKGDLVKASVVPPC